VSAIVNPQKTVWVLRRRFEKIEQVDPPVPMRVGIDFLQCHDIRALLLEQGGDLAQVALNTRGPVEALIGG
jgi:hypothetical protein